MNLHQAVRGAISAINSDITGTVLVSTGSTTAPDGKRTPTYADPVTVTLQVQALSAKEIQHLDSLNITGTMRGIWVSMQIEALNRKTGKGGDLIVIADGPPTLNGTWLAVQALENWDRAGWSHVAGQLQVGS